jgi:hypothetical protein
MVDEISPFLSALTLIARETSFFEAFGDIFPFFGHKFWI